MKNSKTSKPEQECPECKIRFKNLSRPQQKYCSRECFNSFSRKNPTLRSGPEPREERKCIHCESSFWLGKHRVNTANKNGSNHGRYCSRKCYLEARWGNPPPAVKEKTCNRCNVLYKSTSENFPPSRKTKSGLRAICKPCIALEAKTRGKPYRQKIRMEILNAYSNNDPKCVCCEERNNEFLTLDHINGGGSEYRRKNPSGQLYFQLRREGFPPGYRILCFNCNWCIGNYGYCPHQKDGTNTDKNFFIPTHRAP